MKTLFLSLAGLVLTVQGFGQTAPKGVAVPAPVQEAFAKAYPNAENPRWEKDKKEYEVAFTQNQAQYELKYNAQGKLLETEETVAPEALPEAVRATLLSDFPGYTVQKAEREDQAGKIVYEVETVKGQEMLELTFNEAGAVLEKEVKRRRKKRD